MQAPEGRVAFPRSLAPLLFALIFVAAIAGAAVATTSRGPELELQVLRLPKAVTPGTPGRHHVAHIRFFVRDSDPAARVTIVGSNLHVVRTLAHRVPLEADQPVSYTWNGQTNGGSLAPPGLYRLRVQLPSQGRDMVFPQRIELRR